MPKYVKLQKWVDVYPQGTPKGDEELNFFTALARHPIYDWRSVGAISKESGLSLPRVEEILNKYVKKGMIIQNPKNSVNWGYWERLEKEYWPTIPDSISDDDKKKRINTAKFGSSFSATPQPAAPPIPTNITFTTAGIPPKIVVKWGTLTGTNNGLGTIGPTGSTGSTGSPQGPIGTTGTPGPTGTVGDPPDDITYFKRNLFTPLNFRSLKLMEDSEEIYAITRDVKSKIETQAIDSLRESWAKMDADFQKSQEAIVGSYADALNYLREIEESQKE
jgi:hypothetical protein